MLRLLTAAFVTKRTIGAVFARQAVIAIENTARGMIFRYDGHCRAADITAMTELGPKADIGQLATTLCPKPSREAMRRRAAERSDGTVSG